MKITEKELLNQGWEKTDIFKNESIVRYEKVINAFHYSLTESKGYVNTNWYKWNLHIDNPSFESVASIEVDTFEHIELANKIFSMDDMDAKIKKEAMNYATYQISDYGDDDNSETRVNVVKLIAFIDGAKWLLGKK